MDSQTAKFIARIAENLPSEISPEVMQEWIQNPKNLQDFLRDLRSPPEASREFTSSMTIKLGTNLQSADDFRRALDDGGFYSTDFLYMPTFTVATEETEVNLVFVSVGELNLRSGATRRNIYERAQQLGLELCTPEVGPQLRLQYGDQPPGRFHTLLIGMEPIADPRGHLSVFSIDHTSIHELWLDHYIGIPEDIDEYFWVFIRPR